ncbi:MAG: multiheme c-type cytochrome [Planctomycetaceae bacterium]
MRPSSWILLSLLACAAFLLRTPAAEGFDCIVVSGPRHGAFFSCSCGIDRRGGMSLALARARGRVLWVEVGDSDGSDGSFVRRFLRERTAAYRIEGEGPPLEELVFRDGSKVLLVFAARADPQALQAAAAGRTPLLVVGAAFDPALHERLAGARGLHLCGDRERDGGGSCRPVGYVGAEGRQIVVVSPDLSARRLDVTAIPGLPPDPLDLAYLDALHVSAGLRVRADLLADPGAAEEPSRCAACHPATVARWEASRHAHALASLGGDASRTCYGCHSILRERPPAPSARLAVACGSCHGDTRSHPAPGSRLPAADCKGCHTTTSSPRFERAAFWARVRCGEEEGDG